MRNLSNPEVEVIVNDGIDEHTLLCRMPTNDERSAYHAGMFARNGRKIKVQVTEQRLKHGLKILTGFKKGTLGIEQDGKLVAFSSEPSDPDYRADWKNLLKTLAPDVVEAAARHMFEGTSTRSASADDVDFEAEDEEEVTPVDPQGEPQGNVPG